VRNEDRWAVYVDETQRGIVARLNLKSGMSVLDVGCGTGALLRRLAAVEPTLRLTGLDVSPAVLRIARFETSGPITFLAGDADALPFADGSFERVVCANLFHYVGDPVQALTEMKRVARAGAEVVVADWCDVPDACLVCGKVRSALDEIEIRSYELSGGDRVNWYLGRLVV